MPKQLSKRVTQFERLIIDAETEPKPESELLGTMPDSIREPRMPIELERPEIPDFANLVHGSIKDPVKLETWRNASREKYHTEHKAKIAKWMAGNMEAYQKYIENAALSAETGRVRAIGMQYQSTGKRLILAWDGDEKRSIQMAHLYASADVAIYDTEAEMLAALWDKLSSLRQANEASQVMGFNTNGFDFPFFMRRSWALRVPFTFPVMAGRYVNSNLSVDLAEIYRCGRNQDYISLDRLSKSLGTKTQKNGEGARFAELWKTDRKTAILYLYNDIAMTQEVGEAMGYSIGA